MQTGKPDGKQDSRRVSRFDSIAQFVALGISIGWLRVAQRFPFMIFGPAAAFIKPAPIWHQFYWPVVLLALAGMVQAGVNLFRPDWVRLPAIYRLVSNVVWITMLCFLLKAGNWIVLTDIPGASAESYRRTVEILNHSLIYALIGLSVVAAYDIFRHLRRLFRTQKQPRCRIATYLWRLKHMSLPARLARFRVGPDRSASCAAGSLAICREPGRYFSAGCSLMRIAPSVFRTDHPRRILFMPAATISPPL